MPPRRPPSPLALETCAPLASDADDYGLACSDDELDERQRAAQRRRIENLGEAYLKGSSLFILSAGLRGPLDKGWENPWKKDRKKYTSHQNGGGRDTDQPIIPETNSRKRRLYQSPTTTSRSRLSVTPLGSSRLDSVREKAITIQPRDRVPALSTEAIGSPRYTRVKAADSRWLKKDRVSTQFQNIDPPPSPTTSVSTRHIKAKTAAHPEGESVAPVCEIARSSSSGRSNQPKPIPAAQTSGTTSKVTHPSSDLTKRAANEQFDNQDVSLRVISSSSQLPKFEYRLRQPSRSSPKVNDQSNLKSGKYDSSKNPVDAFRNLPPRVPRCSPAKLSPTPAVSIHQTEDMDQHDMDDSLTVANASNTMENPSSSHLEKAPPGNQKNDTTSEINLPSAQPAPESPPIPDNITSLYSIAISKSTSARTEDHNNEQQFSTQAAVLMAQNSFQNDLRSPEKSPVLSTRKRRASQGSIHGSSNQVNITPFHRMNSPGRDPGDNRSAPRTGGAQMISTQYMIDAATPFTFSTERKKTDYRLLSSEKDRSNSKKRKTTSFAVSPSVSSSPEVSYYDDEHPSTAIELHPPDARDSHSGSQHSPLPMTLTGTTPPTAQEGPGVESFNLSQAIAEAGSWLQQSFEINKDIAHCKATKPPHNNAANISR